MQIYPYAGRHYNKCTFIKTCIHTDMYKSTYVRKNSPIIPPYHRGAGGAGREATRIFETTNQIKATLDSGTNTMVQGNVI